VLNKISKISFESSDINNYKRLISLAREYYIYLFLGLLSTLVLSGIDAFIAYSIKPIVDNMLLEQKSMAVLPLIIIMIFMIRSVCTFSSNYFIKLTGLSVVMKLRQMLYVKVLRTTHTFHDKHTKAKLINNILNNTNQVANATTEVMLTIVRDGMLTLFLFIVMFLICWQMTVICLFISPLIVIIVKYFSKRIRNSSVVINSNVVNMLKTLEQGTYRYKIVHMFQTQQLEEYKFNAIAKKHKNFEMKSQISGSLSSAIIQLIISVPLSIGAIMIASDSTIMTVGGFTAIIITMGRIMGPLKSLTSINVSLQSALVAANNIFGVLDAEEEEDKGTKQMKANVCDIVLSDVYFSYGNKSILSNINMHVKANTTVAIVGRSGSGKTTLVNLLPRFYNLDRGSILINGVDITDLKLEELRSLFTYVGQDPLLFKGTIIENIMYGCKAKPSQEHLENVLEAAYVTEFTNSMPDGIHTDIGDNGSLLSGGQKQRVSIARALLKDAPIIILDEATSALDLKSEKYIQKSIENLTANKTAIVIAHRLSTIRNADKIYVVNDGRVLEEGSHNELIKKKSYYYTLYNLQFSDDKQNADI
jgi:ATP-binding cassette, subfamily B, bacterial MsbA